MDPELLDWMGRTGCERILFGAESANPEILRRIRKGISPEQTRRAVAMTREAGIGVLASFVLGLPGETPKTLRQTIEFADSLRVPYSLNLLTPYVGTEIRERAAEWGIHILSSDWRLYGQGRALTATPAVGPWHLSRAVNQYQRSVRQYLEDLLKEERRGMLGPTHAEELAKHRHWSFLRKLIGEEILERHGKISGRADGKEIGALTKSLARPLRMPAGEIRRHVEPLLRDGHIGPVPQPGGGQQWFWAPR